MDFFAEVVATGLDQVPTTPLHDTPIELGESGVENQVQNPLEVGVARVGQRPALLGRQAAGQGLLSRSERRLQPKPPPVRPGKGRTDIPLGPLPRPGRVAPKRRVGAPHRTRERERPLNLHQRKQSGGAFELMADGRPKPPDHVGKPVDERVGGTKRTQGGPVKEHGVSIMPDQHLELRARSAPPPKKGPRGRDETPPTTARQRGRESHPVKLEADDLDRRSGRHDLVKGQTDRSQVPGGLLPFLLDQSFASAHEDFVIYIDDSGTLLGRRRGGRRPVEPLSPGRPA